MANLAIVTTVRQMNGADVTAVYMGTLKDDGWVYFNDEIWWRCRSDKSSLQRFYIPKQVWVPANDSMVSSIKALNVTQVQNLINGGGSIAPGGQGIEDALTWADAIASDNSHGYDQISRWGPDYDCSSLVYEAFRVGGGFNLPTHSGYTGTMVTDFTAAGFVWLAGQGNSVDECLRGDILLNVQDHVEIYMGGGQLLGAHYNEYGGTQYGEPGDQTGNEISYGGFYSFPWDGILRYPGN